MKRHGLPVSALALLLGLAGCESTPERPEDDTGEVTISPAELRPLREFAFETNRVLFADFVRIEASRQFFEQHMGYTRDPRFVERTPPKILEDGTKFIILRNANLAQKTNIDPDLLPRVYFGASGLQIRALVEIRIYLRPARSVDRPVYLDVTAKSQYDDCRLYVSGRLQHEKPVLRINSALIWSEEKGEYLHRASIG